MLMTQLFLLVLNLLVFNNNRALNADMIEVSKWLQTKSMLFGTQAKLRHTEENYM